MPAWRLLAGSGVCQVSRLQKHSDIRRMPKRYPTSPDKGPPLFRVQIPGNLKGSFPSPRAGAARIHGVRLPPAPGAVAQLGERHVRIVEVRGSIPLRSTTGLQRAAGNRSLFCFLKAASIRQARTCKATGRRSCLLPCPQRRGGLRSIALMHLRWLREELAPMGRSCRRDAAPTTSSHRHEKGLRFPAALFCCHCLLTV